jgi:uncharacterized protein YceH (UPF0502 family)
MDTPKSLPVLDATELRVLGSLIEKSRTTPEYYPMSINGLTAACNQKTSRKPVVQYNEEMVALTLDSLKKRGLVSTATGGSSRTVKFKHNFAIVFPVVPAELSLICLLILRGPQTPGELNTNSGRLYEFETIDDVQQTLEKLAADEPPYVIQLPRRPGQKEVRYAHLLAGEPQMPEDDSEQPIIHSASALEARVTKLEEELAEMKTAFEKLMKELMG